MEQRRIQCRGRMWSPRGWIEHAAVIIRGGVIEYAGREADCPSELVASLQAEVDAGEGYLVPGFIDLHVHGALGRAVDEVRAGGSPGEPEVSSREGKGSVEPVVVELLPRLSTFLASCGVT
ncbi:MAG: hypothetical protein QJR13_04440, partial [Bacillota bacterium]|nr:hypothetical protein [Bacillota bacterium]